MHHRLMAELHQRVGELQRMHHAAARIGGMGEYGDAQRLHAAASAFTAAGPKPSSGWRAKSQIASAVLPSVMVTRRSAVIAPISALAMPRAANSAVTAGISAGRTASR